ncbi:MAG: lysozyme inhibitor LprI family protein [Pseudomonadota bacterium]
MFIRLTFIFAAAFTWVCHAVPQSSITITEFDGVELLTYEEIERDDPPYPFEPEVNACIEKDILDRGIGNSCIGLVWKYCPQESPGRGVNGAMACSQFATNYWSKRLQTALEDILATYETLDTDEPDTHQRASQLNQVQTHWDNWRNAKCGFARIADHHSSRWSQMQSLNCVYELTAVRALELEALRRNLSLD